MQCAEFEQRLNAVLDDRRRPEADQRLAAHAAQCENCQQLLDEHAALLASLKNVVTPPLVPGFSFRVVRAAQTASKPAAVQIADRQRWLAAGPLLTSAAAMLMALSAVWYLRQVSDRSDDASPLVFNSSGASPGGLAIAGRGPRRADISSTSTNSADWLIDLPRLPSRWRAYRSALGDISMASLRLEEMEQLAAGMRPLRESFAVIWDTIRRTIPSSSFDAAPQSGETPTTMRTFEHRRVA